MPSTLIEKGIVLTVNSSDDVYNDGYLFFDDDRITAVAEGAAPEAIRDQVDKVIDATGQIVTSNGYLLQPGITLPANAQSITVGADGTVSYTTPGVPTPTVAGNLQLADFVNPTGLQPIGENLYVETAASGAAQVGAGGANGLGTLKQGMVEGSNVNVVSELVDMIEAQRAYEMNSKAISAGDQMLQYINQQL